MSTPSKMSQSALDLLKQVLSEGSVGLLLRELGFDMDRCCKGRLRKASPAA